MYSFQNFTEDQIERLERFVNNDVNAVKYLALDPGKTTGACGYDKNYYLQFMYVVSEDMMVRFLNLFNYIDKCIIEDFKLYPNKAKKQIYSDFPASRVIGNVEFWTGSNGIELVKQGAHLKDTGYKFIGKKPLPKTNPMNHPMDAHVHFMYWAVTHNKINAADLLRHNNA